MDILKKGTYVGTTRSEARWEGILISETHFEERFASAWHYHENPYFTFVLQGGSVEERKHETLECQPSQLLYYNFDEPHRNSNYQARSRNVNIEFDRQWLCKQNLTPRDSNNLTDRTAIEFALLKILKEHRTNDSLTLVSLELLSHECLDLNKKKEEIGFAPVWVSRIREILHDRWNEVPTLQGLSSQLHLHPVTISRFFSKYFRCTLGDYMRRLKTEHALCLLKNTSHSLFDIALQCGFADSSHFNRVFKAYTGLLPSEFRNL